MAAWSPSSSVICAATAFACAGKHNLGVSAQPRYAKYFTGMIYVRSHGIRLRREKIVTVEKNFAGQKRRPGRHGARLRRV